jgi:hypothetical protein
MLIVVIVVVDGGGFVDDDDDEEVELGCGCGCEVWAAARVLEGLVFNSDAGLSIFWSRSRTVRAMRSKVVVMRVMNRA